MCTLSSRLIDKAPRNPAQKVSSDYKAWEFLMYLFWPGTCSSPSDSPTSVLEKFLCLGFWDLVRISSSPISCPTDTIPSLAYWRRITAQELLDMHLAFVYFVQEFERIYYCQMTECIHFCRQCVHLLLHIAPETAWIGPHGLFSQWTMERTIGNLGEEVKQPSNTFMNLSQRGLIRSQLNALYAMFPSLDTLAKALPRGSTDM